MAHEEGNTLHRSIKHKISWWMTLSVTCLFTPQVSFNLFLIWPIWFLIWPRNWPACWVKMIDGRWCASAASVSGCLLPWKLSVQVSHLVEAETLCKSERWKTEPRSLAQKEEKRKYKSIISVITCCTCGSLAKEILAKVWLCRFSRCAVSSPSSISTRPAQTDTPDSKRVKCVLRQKCLFHEAKTMTHMFNNDFVKPWLNRDNDDNYSIKNQLWPYQHSLDK